MQYRRNTFRGSGFPPAEACGRAGPPARCGAAAAGSPAAAPPAASTTAEDPPATPPATTAATIHEATERHAARRGLGARRLFRPRRAWNVMCLRSSSCLDGGRPCPRDRAR
ncbi:MAG: hypothetical protein F4018_08920, partial [Acidobacteria bacterium]|nr:hypothetical protein [Acidobacteriota bacterium]